MITGRNTVLPVVQETRAAKAPDSSVGLGAMLTRRTLPEEDGEINGFALLSADVNGMEPS